jgi:hypothetical protein
MLTHHRLRRGGVCHLRRGHDDRLSPPDPHHRYAARIMVWHFSRKIAAAADQEIE